MINGVFALVIALTLANTLKPGRFLEPPTSTMPVTMPGARPLRILEDLLGMIPANLVDPFRNNAIIPEEFQSPILTHFQRDSKLRQLTFGPSGGNVVEYRRVGSTNMIVVSKRACPWPLSWLP
jgi:hypothetical protein